MLGPTPAGKKVWQRLQGHALPLRNLDGMDPIVCGKLIDRPFPTDRLESHFRLERTTVLPSLCRHLLVLPHGSMSLTYSVVQFLGSIITCCARASASTASTTPLTARREARLRTLTDTLGSCGGTRRRALGSTWFSSFTKSLRSTSPLMSLSSEVPRNDKP